MTKIRKQENFISAHILFFVFILVIPVIFCIFSLSVFSVPLCFNFYITENVNKSCDLG